VESDEMKMNLAADLIKCTAYELAEKLASGQVRAREIVDAYLAQIEKLDNKLNAYIVITPESARLVADHVDLAVEKFGLKRAALEEVGTWKAAKVLGENCSVVVDDKGELHPLAGIPVAVKDVVVTKGIQTTAGSKILEDWIPPYDATLVKKLKYAGMPILGKTNMDEFAMGSSTEHSAYGNTRNPWDFERIPGGSGGGSAAAVGAFEAPLAIGTDTGGSIRQPAAVTGTVGVKPTYGAVSRYGLVALASSLDQAGPVARIVLDAALLQDVIQDYDPHDSTSLAVARTNTASALAGARGRLEGAKIGVIKELNGGDVEGFAPLVKKRFDEVVEKLKSAGALITEVSLPHVEYALGAYYLIMPSEASSNLAKFDGVRYGQRVNGQTAEKMMCNTRGEKLGDEVKMRIILGTYALSSGYYDAYYATAQKVRTLIIQDFENAFEQVDVLISPSTPTVAFKFGDKLDNPLAMYLNDITTIPANLAGIPGMSIPGGLAEDDLPMGIQLLSSARNDGKLYEVGAALEKVLPKLPVAREVSSL
jgi:aspartyl-tRNA(Asn)/glutamyl-tRNA(Gln) amidotransferase subunit A